MKQEKLESITPPDNELPPTKKSPEKRERKTSKLDQDLENMKMLEQENRERIYREREIAKQYKVIDSHDTSIESFDTTPKNKPSRPPQKEKRSWFKIIGLSLVGALLVAVPDMIPSKNPDSKPPQDVKSKESNVKPEDAAGQERQEQIDSQDE